MPEELLSEEINDEGAPAEDKNKEALVENKKKATLSQLAKAGAGAAVIAGGSIVLTTFSLPILAAAAGASATSVVFHAGKCYFFTREEITFNDCAKEATIGAVFSLAIAGLGSVLSSANAQILGKTVAVQQNIANDAGKTAAQMLTQSADILPKLTGPMAKELQEEIAKDVAKRATKVVGKKAAKKLGEQAAKSFAKELSQNAIANAALSQAITTGQQEGQKELAQLLARKLSSKAARQAFDSASGEVAKRFAEEVGERIFVASATIKGSKMLSDVSDELKRKVDENNEEDQEKPTILERVANTAEKSLTGWDEEKMGHTLLSYAASSYVGGAVKDAVTTAGLKATDLKDKVDISTEDGIGKVLARTNVDDVKEMVVGFAAGGAGGTATAATDTAMEAIREEKDFKETFKKNGSHILQAAAFGAISETLNTRERIKGRKEQAQAIQEKQIKQAKATQKLNKQQFTLDAKEQKLTKEQEAIHKKQEALDKKQLELNKKQEKEYKERLVKKSQTNAGSTVTPPTDAPKGEQLDIFKRQFAIRKEEQQLLEAKQQLLNEKHKLVSKKQKLMAKSQQRPDVRQQIILAKEARLLNDQQEALFQKQNELNLKNEASKLEFSKYLAKIEEQQQYVGKKLFDLIEIVSVNKKYNEYTKSGVDINASNGKAFIRTDSEILRISRNKDKITIERKQLLEKDFKVVDTYQLSKDFLQEEDIGRNMQRIINAMLNREGIDSETTEHGARINVGPIGGAFIYKDEGTLRATREGDVVHIKRWNPGDDGFKLVSTHKLSQEFLQNDDAMQNLPDVVKSVVKQRMLETKETEHGVRIHSVRAHNKISAYINTDSTTFKVTREGMQLKIVRIEGKTQITVYDKKIQPSGEKPRISHLERIFKPVTDPIAKEFLEPLRKRFVDPVTLGLRDGTKYISDETDPVSKEFTRHAPAAKDLARKLVGAKTDLLAFQMKLGAEAVGVFDPKATKDLYKKIDKFNRDAKDLRHVLVYDILDEELRAKNIAKNGAIVLGGVFGGPEGAAAAGIGMSAAQGETVTGKGIATSIAASYAANAAEQLEFNLIAKGAIRGATRNTVNTYFNGGNPSDIGTAFATGTLEGAFPVGERNASVGEQIFNSFAGNILGSALEQQIRTGEVDPKTAIESGVRTAIPSTINLGFEAAVEGLFHKPEANQTPLEHQPIPTSLPDETTDNLPVGKESVAQPVPVKNPPLSSDSFEVGLPPMERALPYEVGSADAPKTVPPSDHNPGSKIDYLDYLVNTSKTVAKNLKDEAIDAACSHYRKVKRHVGKALKAADISFSLLTDPGNALIEAVIHRYATVLSIMFSKAGFLRLGKFVASTGAVALGVFCDNDTIGPEPTEPEQLNDSLRYITSPLQPLTLEERFQFYNENALINGRDTISARSQHEIIREYRNFQAMPSYQRQDLWEISGGRHILSGGHPIFRQGIVMSR